VTDRARLPQLYGFTAALAAPASNGGLGDDRLQPPVVSDELARKLSFPGATGQAQALACVGARGRVDQFAQNRGCIPGMRDQGSVERRAICIDHCTIA